MSIRQFATLVVLLASPALAADGPIDGTWSVVSITKNGKADEAWAAATREHAGEKYSMSKAGGKSVSGTMKLDAAKKTIDLMPGDGQYKGKTLAGIYELDGETLTICFAEPGKERPAKIANGDGITVAIYKKK